MTITIPPVITFLPREHLARIRLAHLSEQIGYQYGVIVLDILRSPDRASHIDLLNIPSQRRLYDLTNEYHNICKSNGIAVPRILISQRYVDNYQRRRSYITEEINSLHSRLVKEIDNNDPFASFTSNALKSLYAVDYFLHQALGRPGEP